MPIQALIFDFDGLILDTESSEWRVWQAIYAEYGCRLDLNVWAECIGRVHRFFDPYEHLEQLSGRKVDREAMREHKRRRVRELNQKQGLRPGVAEYLRDARRLGLRVGIASSSNSDWVRGHLARLGVVECFSCITCAEHTTVHKPDPAPYLEALRNLNARPAEAIAFEDSPNGIAAATAAGIFCVAVPNPVTRNLNLAAADLCVESLAEMGLEELIGRVEGDGRASDY